MRELKFRVFFFDGEDYSAGKMIGLTEALQEDFINTDNNSMIGYDKCIIINQYTGVKDSEGVEIYESDIVNISGVGLCKVEIQPYCGVVYLSLTGNCDTDAHDCAMEKESVYVVGNIYENEDIKKQAGNK